jgi:Ca-activated chloride channel family protein
MNALPVSLDPTPALPAAPHPYGLGALLARNLPLPLTAVRVRAGIVGSFARVEVEQRFENPYEQPLEAVHIFPLPPGGAVIEAELRAGETVVRAECRERQDARATFEGARRSGHRAALLEAERADVHTLRVTNLPPRTSVTVRIVFVETLAPVDGRLVWRFPTTIPPRYTPGLPLGHEGPGVHPDTDAVPDASRLSPPLRLEGGTRLDLEVTLAGPITSLASSLHAVRMDLNGGTVRVAPSAKATLNRDFVLAFTTAGADRAASRAWTDGRYTAVLVEPPAGSAPRTLARDAVFVLDVSGSMQGVKMEAAKRALTTALHGLLPGDRFRLIAFNHQVTAFRPGFTPYDDRSLADADRWVASLVPDGGTEMLPALQEALAEDGEADRVRTVLLVTDGQSSDEDRLVPAVAHRRNGATVFTLGIDTAVNANLLQRLARVGGGTCELCTPHDDIEGVVARLEARFGSPLASEVRVEGGEAARPEPAVLFSGRPVAVLLEGAPSSLRVTGRLPEGSFAEEVVPALVDVPLGALWARERVASLEDRIALHPHQEEGLRAEILRIALEHGIASRYTAFVAVDRSVTVTGERVEVVQPVEAPADWDLLRDVLAGGGAPAVAPRAGGRMRSPSFARAAAPMAAAPLSAMALGAFPDAPLQEKTYLRDAAAPISDPAGELARSQSADGSFGNDVARTAAALLALVLLGNTRRGGVRQRVVLKAAAWLEARRADPLAALALEALEAAERGETPSPAAAWDPLYAAGLEGEVLRRVTSGGAS